MLEELNKLKAKNDAQSVKLADQRRLITELRVDIRKEKDSVYRLRLLLDKANELIHDYHMGSK